MKKVQVYLTEERFSEAMTALFSFLQENMATKEDFKNFATKDDLKHFATKDDLKNFATKDDIEELRLEMQAGFREIHGELDDIKASLARLEQKTQEDDDAMVAEVEKLKKRVRTLEDTIATLKKQNAFA